MDKRKIVFYILLLLALTGYITNTASAQKSPADTFPVPPANPDQLFYLQRSPNTNTIIVDLNWSNKKELITDAPVKVYWIRYQEKGQKEELSWIQRTFAYGMKVRKLAPEKYEMHFVSYKKYKMVLMRGSDQKFHAYGMINGKQVYVNRVYLHINGGTFWSPNVEYVEFKGKDPATGAELRERLSNVKKED